MDAPYGGCPQSSECPGKSRHPSARSMTILRGGGGRASTWGDGFNNRRLLEPVGKIPPAEAEARCSAMLDERPSAA